MAEITATIVRVEQSVTALIVRSEEVVQADIERIEENVTAVISDNLTVVVPENVLQDIEKVKTFEPDMLKIDSPLDCTGKWVIGTHPNINDGDKFIGLSNAHTPTANEHIDEIFISK